MPRHMRGDVLALAALRSLQRRDDIDQPQRDAIRKLADAEAEVRALEVRELPWHYERAGRKVRWAAVYWWDTYWRDRQRVVTPTPTVWDLVGADDDVLDDQGASADAPPL